MDGEGGDILQVYHELNGTVNWVVSFVTGHSIIIVRIDLDSAPMILRDIVFSYSLCCIHKKIV